MLNEIRQSQVYPHTDTHSTVWSHFAVVQRLSHVQLFVTPWTGAHQASLSFTVSQSLLKLSSIESRMPSNHLVLCHLVLLLLSVFPWVGFSHQVAKVLEFQLQLKSVLPMNIQDWFPLGWIGWISLQSKGTLKSLLQCHSSRASVLRHSAFFIVQLSHPYMTTGKTKAWTRQTFVGKVMSLLFNMLSWLVVTFLPRSKYPPILSVGKI